MVSQETKVVRLENWCVAPMDTNPYLPPEAQRSMLCGEAYGHPLHEDGKYLHTSSIVSVQGREVQTHSGTIYVLGEPDPAYVKHCREQGWHAPTNEVPIKNL